MVSRRAVAASCEFTRLALRFIVGSPTASHEAVVEQNHDFYAFRKSSYSTFMVSFSKSLWQAVNDPRLGVDSQKL